MKKYLQTFLLLLFIVPSMVFAITDIYGNRIPFDASRWSVINYWATWCYACVEEVPELNKLARMAAKLNINVIAVNYDNESASKQAEFAKKYSVSYPLSNSNPLRNKINANNIDALPVSYVVSPAGKVYVLQGAQSLNNYLSVLKQ